MRRIHNVPPSRHQYFTTVCVPLTSVMQSAPGFSTSVPRLVKPGRREVRTVAVVLVGLAEVVVVVVDVSVVVVVVGG